MSHSKTKLALYTSNDVRDSGNMYHGIYIFNKTSPIT